MGAALDYTCASFDVDAFWAHVSPAQQINALFDAAL
jgi:hypothetical protein